MASELQLQTSPAITSGTLYSIVRNFSGQPANNTAMAFEAYNSAHLVNYAVAMTQQGSSGYYQGSFPSWVTAAGQYSITVFLQAGGSPATSDAVVGSGTLTWDGSSEATPPATNDLTTLAYVKIADQISVSTFDTVISQFITAVSAKFTAYMNGKQLVLTNYTEIQNGKNTNYLRVDNYPINSLTSIVLGLNETTQTTVPNTEFVYEKITGLIQFKNGSSYTRPFTGFQNIEINYVGGYPVIPADVQEAVAIQCLKLLNMYSQKNFGVDSKKVGDVQIDYSDAFQFASTYPLLGEVKAMLDPYKDRSY